MQRMVRRHAVAILTSIGLALVAAVSGASLALAGDPATREPITRTILAEASPGNAPGQELYLQEVRIEPGAELATHLHEGTQIATVRSGVLTYNVVSGTASVAHADGTREEVHGPATIRLRSGDAITEAATLVHYGANKGKKPVVILVAALLADGAPLATPVEREGS